MPMPYRIETERLVLRCYQPVDAPLLKATIDASLEHLSIWMPWATQHEPTPLETKIQRLRRMRGDFDLDKDYNFGIFNLDETLLLGGTGLHPRLGAGVLEIGYWMHADYCNQGYAREATGALTQVAFENMGVTRVEIHCNPANQASFAIPRRLGYHHRETRITREEPPSDKVYESMIWELSQAGFELSRQAGESFRRALARFDSTGASL